MRFVAKKPDEVIACPVDWLLERAHSNFKGLPAFIKKSFNKDELWFGNKSIRLITEDRYISHAEIHSNRADKNPDWIVCKYDGLVVMSDEEFKEKYQDPFA